MERTSVQSSNLASVGYDSRTQTLEIQFQNGRVYQYFDVAQDVYSGLMKAASHGRYFLANIKGMYDYRRVR